MAATQNTTVSESVVQLVDSLVILVFAQWVPHQTIQWIANKITAVQANGGSELEVFLVVDQYNQVNILSLFCNE